MRCTITEKSRKVFNIDFLSNIMRGLIPLLFGILLVSPIALASNVTVSFHAPRIRARRRDCSLQRLLHRLGGGSFRRRHLTSKLCPLYQPEWRIQTLQLRIPPRKEPQALSKHNLPNQRLRYPSVSARYFSDTIRESTVGICSRRFGLETLEAAPLE